METISKQIADRRLEIAQADALLMQAVFLIFALCIISYIVAIATNTPELHKLTLVLVVALPFFVARQEYMIHRPATWIKTVQHATPPQDVSAANQGSIRNWEEWKDSLVSTKILLPLLDILAGFAALYVLFCSSTVLWATDRTFVIWSVVGLIAGILACVAGAKLAGK